MAGGFEHTDAATFRKNQLRRASAAGPPRAIVAGGAPFVPGAKARWSNAKRSKCLGGHSHDSGLEARVCDRLQVEYESALYATSSHPLKIVRQIRLPLLSACLNRGKPLYMTIDFGIYEVRAARRSMENRESIGRAVVGADADYHLVRLVDAKGRPSREWARGVAMLEATYNVRVEIVTK